MTDDLIKFLTDRIAEDEDGALAASPGPWHPDAEYNEVLAVDDITVCDGFALSGRQLCATTDHIATWDPPRVLAEVALKRQMIDLVMAHEARVDGEWGCGSRTPPEQMDGLLILALPYADHPEYREEWRPVS